MSKQQDSIRIKSAEQTTWRGVLKIEYVVWCACGNWARCTKALTKKAAGVEFKRRGWTYRTKRGWTCTQKHEPAT